VTVREALDSVLAEELHDRFEQRRRALLDARVERRRTGLAGRRALDGPPGDWRVTPAHGIERRVVELCVPADPEAVARALASDADVVMADLEDTLVPTRERIEAAHACLREQVAAGRPDRPALVVRPRGLHLDEPRVRVGEAPLSASFYDLAAFLTGAAPAVRDHGARLHLYLPKIESAAEAGLWADALAAAERALELEHGAVVVSVLVETVGGVLELDAIVWALRDRVTALNAGRWDYLYDLVRCAGRDAAVVLPERGLLSMDLPFLVAYQRRIVEVAHRRGALAIGGMAPAAPADGAAGPLPAAVLAAVAADKRREAALGFDGAVVADPAMADAVREAFAAAVPASAPSASDPIAAIVDLGDEWRGRPLALSGLRDAIAVAVVYLDGWLAGRGFASIGGRPEELSCAEICRALLWSWLQQGIVLEDGETLTAARFAGELRAAAGEREAAAELLRELVAGAELRDDVVPLALSLIEPA
jgi:malate synthase